MVIAMLGWRGPAEYRGLSQAAARRLRLFFEAMGCQVIVVPE
jgi:hypothetical protein